MEKKPRGRRPKVQVDHSIVNEEIANEVVEQVVEEVVAPRPEAPQTPSEESESFYSYKCIECGNVPKTRQCKRCSGHITRRL